MSTKHLCRWRVHLRSWPCTTACAWATLPQLAGAKANLAVLQLFYLSPHTSTAINFMILNQQA